MVRQGIEEAQRAVDECQKEKEAIDARLQDARAVLAAWKTIEASGGNNMPMTAPPAPAGNNVGAGVGYIPPRGRPLPRQGIDAVLDALVAKNKTAFIGQAIEASGERGVTPIEIRQAALRRSFEVWDNYPYTVLFKMKKKGTVEVKPDGRYVSKKITEEPW